MHGNRESNRNESSVFIYTDDFIETPISGNIVTGIEIYGGGTGKNEEWMAGMCDYVRG